MLAFAFVNGEGQHLTCTAGRPEPAEESGKLHVIDPVVPTCGSLLFWRWGTLWKTSFKDGSALKIECIPPNPLRLKSAALQMLFLHSGRQSIIAKCVFRDGCNSILVTEEVARNICATPIRLVETEWLNLDGGSNDGIVRIYRNLRTAPEEPALDEVTWTYSVKNDVLTIKNLKSAYPGGRSRLSQCLTNSFIRESRVAWIETVQRP
jgi:hypothetical protein